jgi:flagellar assembly protein FliH
MTTTRLIRGQDLGGAATAWQAPEVSGPTLRGRAGQLDDARNERQRAERAGFEEGRRAGLEAARQETAARVRALEQALDALSRPFEGLEQRFHEEIVELVKAVARQLLRREMRLDPGHLVGVVREGIAALPMAATDIVVRLHPEDAAVVRECLAGDADATRSWRIEPDPLMERGGCVVLTPQSQVDGRLETRLGRAIATLFEDERQDHGEAPGTDARG